MIEAARTFDSAMRESSLGSPPTTVVEFVDQAARKRPRKPQPSERATWFEGCVVDDRDRIIPNLANVLVALRNAPQIADAFAFDAMLSAPILTKALPLAQNGESASADPSPRPVHDSDVSQLQEWLQHQGKPKIGKDQVHQAVDQRAMSAASTRCALSSAASNGTGRIGSTTGFQPTSARRRTPTPRG